MDELDDIHIIYSSDTADFIALTDKELLESRDVANQCSQYWGKMLRLAEEEIQRRNEQRGLPSGATK